MRCPTLADLPAPPAGRVGWPWTCESPQLPDTMPDGRPWPRISIVTPSFNQGQYIEETIRSVLLQGYPDLEYIVIDGGSTDESVEIIRKYEPWLAYWVSEKDRGQSHAINKGFERCTGEIVNWLCSDDLLAPGALAAVACVLPCGESAWLVGASVEFEGDDPLSGTPDTRRPTADEMLYDFRTFPQPSTFWTRQLWEAAGPVLEALGGEEMFFAMDYELWLRMRTIMEPEFIDAVLSYARVHSAQKGPAAARDGLLSRFTRQRVLGALAGARDRGIPSWLWLARSWRRHFMRAVRSRRWHMLRGSDSHRDALRLALRLRPPAR